MQASFVAEEWVDHALSKSCEVEGKLTQSEKALADSEKRLKDTSFHLAEVEKGRKNAEAALAGFEKQAEELRVSLKNNSKRNWSWPWRRPSSNKNSSRIKMLRGPRLSKLPTMME